MAEKKSVKKAVGSAPIAVSEPVQMKVDETTPSNVVPVEVAEAVKPKKPARKSSSKSAALAVAETAADTPPPPAQNQAKPATSAKEKTKKVKLVRDSFTMPETEYKVLADIKKACIKAGFDIKKSELLRIGVALLGQAEVAQLKTLREALPAIKTGRPKK